MMQEKDRLLKSMAKVISLALTYKPKITYVIWGPRRTPNARRPGSGRARSGQITTHNHVDVGMECLGLFSRVLKTDKVSDVAVDRCVNVGFRDGDIGGLGWTLEPVPLEVRVERVLATNIVLAVGDQVAQKAMSGAGETLWCAYIHWVRDSHV